MKVITILLAIFGTIISAAELRSVTNEQIKTEAVAVADVAETTMNFKCPGQSAITQVNGHTGAVIDRMNFRCNDKSDFTSSGDIGAPIGYTKSVKLPSIILAPSVKGFTSVSVGYAFYAPYNKWVVAAVRYCVQDKCDDQFIYGLTICSAETGKTYTCPKTLTYSETGKVFSGVKATYSPQQYTGYVTELVPLFN